LDTDFLASDKRGREKSTIHVDFRQNGLIFFLAANIQKQAGSVSVKHMSDNEKMDEKVALFLMAGLACFLCLPAIFLATRPLIWLLHTSWLMWPLFAIWTFVPVSAAFAVLYRSSWHRERPRVRRIFSMILSSCVIFGVDLLLLVFLIVATCLVMGLGRVMGGN
jgi:hypothetical protein